MNKSIKDAVEQASGLADKSQEGNWVAEPFWFPYTILSLLLLPGLSRFNEA